MQTKVLTKPKPKCKCGKKKLIKKKKKFDDFLLFILSFRICVKFCKKKKRCYQLRQIIIIIINAQVMCKNPICKLLLHIEPFFH